MALTAPEIPNDQLPRDLIPMKEAAEEYSEENMARQGRVGVKYATLRSWAARDWLTTWKIGGRTFVSRAQLESLLRPKLVKRDDTAEG